MTYYLLAAFCSSLALATASFYVVERPFIRLGHRLVRRRGPPALSPASTASMGPALSTPPATAS